MSIVEDATVVNSMADAVDITRRRGSHHDNIWDYDFIHSLQTPYAAPSYAQHAEMLIREIKGMFNAIGGGQTSPSAYDTAWVARVPAFDGFLRPQFPETLQWVLENQLPDGSWGIQSHFLVSDRLLNTLACVLTLISWKIGHLQVDRGVEFIKQNAELLKDESLMTTDFEIIFPALLREAELVGLSLPYDLPCLKLLWRKRDARLAKLSEDGTFQCAETCPLLYSLEGLQDMIVDWERMIDVQCKDGSFLGSPASTACVLIHTGDHKCLAFLNSVLDNFGRCCVPCLYPIDLVEHLRAVDIVESLGIDRHFEKEIKEVLDYVYRYWNEGGIGLGRDNSLPDLEITAMGFRVLRLHGYDVSAEVFEKFKDGKGNFVVSPEGSEFAPLNKQITAMLSLYRASHLAFPLSRENVILADAKQFSTKYLEAVRHKLSGTMAFNQENLAREVEYALEFPWHTDVPRLRALRSMELYQPDYSWLGKTLYKLPCVNNGKYLQLAKLDFNILQSVHQSELKQVTRWLKESGLKELTFARERPVEFHYTVAMGTFEAELGACRIAFVKVATLLVVLDDIYDTYGTLDELKLFTEAVKRWDISAVEGLPDYMKICYRVWYNTVSELATETLKEQGRDMLPLLRTAWEDCLEAFLQEAEWMATQCVPPLEDYIQNGIRSSVQRVLHLSVIFLMGKLISDDMLREIGLQSKFVELVGFVVRITDDIMTYQAEKERGELASCIECYVKENPECTEQEALKHFYDALDQAFKELNWELLKPSNVPLCCRKLLFNTARMVRVIYKYRDGYGISSKETKCNILTTLIQPLPM